MQSILVREDGTRRRIVMSHDKYEIVDVLDLWLDVSIVDAMQGVGADRDVCTAIRLFAESLQVENWVLADACAGYLDVTYEVCPGTCNDHLRMPCDQCDECGVQSEWERKIRRLYMTMDDSMRRSFIDGRNYDMCDDELDFMAGVLIIGPERVWQALDVDVYFDEL